MKLNINQQLKQDKHLKKKKISNVFIPSLLLRKLYINQEFLSKLINSVFSL